MKTEKQITMSLDLAKQMLGKDEAMDMLIKQNFSDEELGIKPELLKKWEDIGEMKGFYIDRDSNIEYIHKTLSVNKNRNILPTEELAEAMLALCQLLYLRNIYNDGWEPDWEDRSIKYVIHVISNTLCSNSYTSTQRSMFFKTAKLRDEFYENFKDLLETAKPLL